MITVIALTNHGGMEIGRAYQVGAELALTLVSLGRCRYEHTAIPAVEDDRSEPEQVKKTNRKRTKK